MEKKTETPKLDPIPTPPLDPLPKPPGLAPPPRPKCDLCDRPATNEAYDMAEVPTGGSVSNKVPTGKVHRGCDEHPASKRARRK